MAKVAETRRSAILKQVADGFLAEHDAWASPNNRRPDHLDESYLDSCELVLRTFRSGAIPADCRALAKAVDALAQQFDEYNILCATDDYPPPSDAFCGAVQALRDCRSKMEFVGLKPLESIAQLEKEQVPHSQIARIYGFLDARGEPQPWKVEEELAKPGKHTGPGTGWVDPRVLETQAEMRAGDESDIDSGDPDDDDADDFGDDDGDGDPLGEHCPESIEELIRQGVGVRQIAQMHGCSVVAIEEVRSQMAMAAKAKEAGAMPVDVADGDEPADDGDQTHNQEPDFSRPEDPAAAILNLAAEGWKPRNIARELEIDPKEVRRVLQASQAAMRRKVKRATEVQTA